MEKDYKKQVTYWIKSLSQDELDIVLTDCNKYECDKLIALYSECQYTEGYFFDESESSQQPGYQLNDYDDELLKTYHIQFYSSNKIHGINEIRGLSLSTPPEQINRILNLVRICDTKTIHDTFTIESHSLKPDELLELLTIISGQGFLQVPCHLVKDQGSKDWKYEAPRWFYSKKNFDIGEYIAQWFERLIWSRFWEDNKIDPRKFDNNSMAINSNNNNNNTTINQVQNNINNQNNNLKLSNNSNFNSFKPISMMYKFLDTRKTNLKDFWLKQSYDTRKRWAQTKMSMIMESVIQSINRSQEKEEFNVMDKFTNQLEFLKSKLKLHLPDLLEQQQLPPPLLPQSSTAHSVSESPGGLNSISSILSQSLINYPVQFIEFICFTPLERVGTNIESIMREIFKHLQSCYIDSVEMDLMKSDLNKGGGKGSGGNSGNDKMGSSGGKKKGNSKLSSVSSSLSSSSSSSVKNRKKKPKDQKKSSNSSSNHHSKSNSNKTTEDHRVSSDSEDVVQTRPRRHSLPMDVQPSIKNSNSIVSSTTEDEDTNSIFSEGDKSTTPLNNKKVLNNNNNTPSKSVTVATKKSNNVVKPKESRSAKKSNTTPTPTSHSPKKNVKTSNHKITPSTANNCHSKLQTKNNSTTTATTTTNTAVNTTGKTTNKPNSIKSQDQEQEVEEVLVNNSKQMEWEEPQEIKENSTAFIQTISEKIEQFKINTPPSSHTQVQPITTNSTSTNEDIYLDEEDNDIEDDEDDEDDYQDDETDFDGDDEDEEDDDFYNQDEDDDLYSNKNNNNNFITPQENTINHPTTTTTTKHTRTISKSAEGFQMINNSSITPNNTNHQKSIQESKISNLNSITNITNISHNNQNNQNNSNSNSNLSKKESFSPQKSPQKSTDIYSLQPKRLNLDDSNTNNNQNNIQNNIQNNKSSKPPKQPPKLNDSSLPVNTSKPVMIKSNSTSSIQGTPFKSPNNNQNNQNNQNNTNNNNNNNNNIINNTTNNSQSTHLVYQDKFKDWRHNKLFNQIQIYKQLNPFVPLQAYLQPWDEPPLPCPHPKFSIKLHQEILDFVSDVGERTYPHVQNCHQVINLIKAVVKRLWPNADLDIYGSFMTGLWLPSSDIDIVVNYGKNMSIKPKNAQFLLEVLEKQIRSDLNSYILTMLCIPSAKIPVIKLVTKDNIAVDISFRESPTSIHTGIAARDLVANNVKEVVGLYPLAIVLKWFLRERGLNNTYTGGLSSYCLVLMLISFLKNNEHCPKKNVSQQQQQQNINSNIMDNNNLNLTLKAKPCTCENADQISGLNIGCALMRFLEYYGVIFNYQTTGLSIEENKYTFPLPKDDPLLFNPVLIGTPNQHLNGNQTNTQQQYQVDHQPIQYCSTLVVIDPFVPGKNVASGAFNFGRVKAAFQYAFATLSNTSMHELSFENETILSKILMPTDRI